MSLDHEETIRRLQSESVRSSLKNLIINLLTLVAVFTGMTFDIDFIKEMIDYGLFALVNGASVWLAWRGYRGRVTAERKIDTSVPLKQEIKEAVASRLPWHQ